MKKIITTIIAMLLATLMSSNNTDIILEIKRQSQLMASGISNENTAILLDIFSKNAYLLPEYHKTLNGQQLITTYFNEFFKKTDTVKYLKTYFEIQPIGSYYIELGNYEHSYLTPKGENFNYNGKYTTYWSIENKVPKVIAHIWGASNYFEAQNLDFIEIKTPDSVAMKPSSELDKKIKQHSNYIHETVLKGDSKKQISTYSDDAIYMTYYDAPFIGKQAIAKYFENHYNPDNPMVALRTTIIDVIDLGEYALKLGEYYVEWKYENTIYFIKGKGLTLYKVNKEEPLLIYRQMINHSMPAKKIEQDIEQKVKKILLHLDNQQLSIDDYLSVYEDENLEVLPPYSSKILGKQNFKNYLESERKKGSLIINHKMENMQIYSGIIIVSGSSKGEFKPHGEQKYHSFTTKNLMVIKKADNHKLKILKLIWN